MEFACLFATALGITPEKNAFPKSSLPTASFSSEPFVFLSSFVCAANPDDGNSVVHCIVAHPSTTQVAARYTAAMAATPALLQVQPFLFSLFFLHCFLLFFSTVGICNERMA